MGNFHNPEADLDRFRFRLGFAAVFVLFAFCLLLGRFFWLQVIQHDFYQTRAEDNRIALTLDGQVVTPLEYGDQIKIRLSRRKFHLIRMQNTRYYQMLREKLSWGS